MILAILSDIHGNYEALKPVLADIANSKADRVVCLGDCIGYGPQPEEVLREIMRLHIETIIGNHELGVCDPSQLAWFNPLARHSLEKSLQMLSDASIAFIKQLPNAVVVEGCRCVHGYPPDSARTYLFQKSLYDVAETMKSLDERICFVGHTHDLERIACDGRRAVREDLKQGLNRLDPGKRYIINVGSVGQPRDGNNNAKYILYDLAADCIDVRFIPYDIAATVKRIKAAGLPEQHANRLW